MSKGYKRFKLIYVNTEIRPSGGDNRRKRWGKKRGRDPNDCYGDEAMREHFSRG